MQITTIELVAQTLSTDELAAIFKVKPQSIRSALCRDGHYLGLRPIKPASRRLLWRAAEVARILNGGEQ